MFSRRQLVHLILPLMGEQFLAVTIGLSDTFMVSSVGEAAVSGISLVDSINVLLIQIFSALATGGAVVAAQYLGREERQNACTAAKQLLYSITAMSIGIMALCLCFRSQILSLVFGRISDDVMRNANVYFFLTALSYPFLAVYNAGAALFRSMGNSKISMLVSLIDNIVHIGGDALLIYGFRMGAAGAGVATLAARILAAAAMFLLICRRDNMVFIDRPFHPEFVFPMVKRILNIGIPSGLENGMFQIGKLVVQRQITAIGTAAIAANAVAGSVSNVSNIPGNAISLALITVVGQCLGAGDCRQAVFYTKRLILMSYLTMGALNLTLFCLAGPVVGAFGLDTAAAESARQILYVFALCSATIWTPAFVLPNTLRAAGDVRFTMLTSIFSMWVFRIGFAYVLAGMLGLGVLGVWYAMYIDWGVRTVIFFFRFRSGKWKEKRVI